MRHGSPSAPGNPELRGSLINAVHEGMEGAGNEAQEPEPAEKLGRGNDRGLDAWA